MSKHLPSELHIVFQPTFNIVTYIKLICSKHSSSAQVTVPVLYANCGTQDGPIYDNEIEMTSTGCQAYGIHRSLPATVERYVFLVIFCCNIMICSSL